MYNLHLSFCFLASKIALHFVYSLVFFFDLAADL